MKLELCTKHGIELHFDKSRKLRAKSYAVYLNGIATVSHATTRATYKGDSTRIVNAVRIEQANNPTLTIL